MNEAETGPPRAMTREEIRRRARALGPWFHNIDLNGVKTAPHHFLGDYPAIKWNRFADAVPQDLRGTTVLDASETQRIRRWMPYSG